MKTSSRRFAHRLMTGLFVLSGLAGCVVGPRYQRPQVRAPEQWDAQASNQTNLWPASNWWRAFRSSELDGLVEQALRKNYDLKAAESRVNQARAQYRIARAPLFPTLGLTAQAARNKNQSKPGSTSFNNSVPYDYYTGTLDTSYELDFWGKNRSAAAAAGATLQASIYDRQTIEITLTTEVMNNYFQFVSLTHRLAIAQQILANAQTVLTLVEKQQRAGAVSALEVTQQKVVVANLRASIPALIQQKQQALSALAVLLGRAPEGFEATQAAPDSIRLPVLPAGLPSGLLERRPDIRKAEADLIAAKANIGAAKAAFFPTIQLTASGGFASAALSSLIRPDSTFYSLAAGLTAPIFEGGRISGQYAFAKARYDELLQQYYGAIISAFKDVEDALNALQQLSEQEQATQEAAEQARESYRLAEVSYRRGATGFLTVLDSQRTVFDAETALDLTRLAHLNAAASLFKALGGGEEIPSAKENSISAAR